MKTGKEFLDEFESVLDNAEEVLRRISGQCRLQCTGHLNVFCSRLPAHWRSNKSLPTPFIILALFPVPDGTRVCVSAGNEENFSADVKNNTAEFIGQMARFSDLRFVGKSGRGKNFNLSITIFTVPYTHVVIVPNILKVTVDGPRETRTTSKYTGQHISFPKKFRYYDGRHIDNIDQQPFEYIKTSNINLLKCQISNSNIEQKHTVAKILSQPQSNFPFLSSIGHSKQNFLGQHISFPKKFQYYDGRSINNIDQQSFEYIKLNNNFLKHQISYNDIEQKHTVAKILTQPKSHFPFFSSAALLAAASVLNPTVANNTSNLQKQQQQNIGFYKLSQQEFSGVDSVNLALPVNQQNGTTIDLVSLLAGQKQQTSLDHQQKMMLLQQQHLNNLIFYHQQQSQLQTKVEISTANIVTSASASVSLPTDCMVLASALSSFNTRSKDSIANKKKQQRYNPY